MPKKRNHRPARRARHRRHDPLPTIADFGEAAMFALEAPADLEAVDEVIAIVDARHRLLRILVDAHIPEAARMWRPRRPVHERGDEAILHVLVRDHVAVAPPSDDDVMGYRMLKAAYADVGHVLLDVMITDGDAVQSLALAVDPDTAWGGAAADTDSA